MNYSYVIITSLIFLLLSNSITLRRDKSILYSRVLITILLISCFITYHNLFFLFLNKGIGIFSGLFTTTINTTVFHIFIFLISSVILLLTSFYPRKVWLREYRSQYIILYSTISHVGFILWVLIIYTGESTQGFIFYLIVFVLFILLLKILLYMNLPRVYFGIKKWYNLYSIPLKLSVLVVGTFTITSLLSLSLLHCAMLIFIMTIILVVLPFIRINDTPLLCDLLPYIVITIYGLTDSVMTTELYSNYPNLSYIDISLIHLAIARILIYILFKDKQSYFDRLKNVVNQYKPHIIKKPLYISIGILLLLLLIISTNLVCWYLGILVCKKTYFTFYIFILTKLILVNSIFSFIMLSSIPSEQWYNVIAMNVWLPVVILPSSLVYYFYILPFVMNIELPPINIPIRLANFEKIFCKFNLAIFYLLDSTKMFLSPLKKNLFFLKQLFFMYMKTGSKYLISLNNLPAQLGKFFMQWSNWALNKKPESIINNNNFGVEFGFSAIKKSYAKCTGSEVFNYLPKFTAVNISSPLGFIGRTICRENTNIANHLAQKKHGHVFFAKSSLEDFKNSFQTSMQNSENVAGFFSTMEKLRDVKLILSGNSTVELHRVGLNTVSIVFVDISKKGFLGFNKNLVNLDRIPLPRTSSSLDSNRVKKLDCTTDTAMFETDLLFANLNSKSYKILDCTNDTPMFETDLFASLTSKSYKILELTDPNKIGYNRNPLLYTQRNHSSYNDYSAEASRINSLQDSYKRSFQVIYKKALDESIIIRTTNLQKDNLVFPLVLLQFDATKLSSSTDWIYYLRRILKRARLAFISEWEQSFIDQKLIKEPQLVEKANVFDNFSMDYATDEDDKSHFHTLCDAIKKVTGKNIQTVFPLSMDFIESLKIISNDSVYRDAYYNANSQRELISINHINELSLLKSCILPMPLTNSEIDFLIRDLIYLSFNIKIGLRSKLGHIGINQIDRNINSINYSERDGLLTRLLFTKKESFLAKNGRVVIYGTNIVNLVSSMRGDLKLPNNYNSPLTKEEMKCLMEDLLDKQLNMRISIVKPNYLCHLDIDMKWDIFFEDSNPIKINSLLTRLFFVNRDLFYVDIHGKTLWDQTNINKLADKLNDMINNNNVN